MNIQKISTNTTQQNFKGAYIIKGEASDVKLAKKIISGKCSGLANLYPKSTSVKGFDECRTMFLNDIYSDTQPNIKMFIGTNEHSRNISSWRNKYTNSVNLKSIFLSSNKKINREDIITMLDFIRYKLNMIEDMVIQYERAEIAQKNGNDDLMSDFIIDSYLQAKQRLQELKDYAVVAMEEIKEHDALTVLKAINEKRFNYITGEILSK